MTKTTESTGVSRRSMLKQLAAGGVALGVAGPSLLLSGCAATASRNQHRQRPAQMTKRQCLH